MAPGEPYLFDIGLEYICPRVGRILIRCSQRTTRERGVVKIWSESCTVLPRKGCWPSNAKDVRQTSAITYLIKREGLAEHPSVRPHNRQRSGNNGPHTGNAIPGDQINWVRFHSCSIVYRRQHDYSPDPNEVDGYTAARGFLEFLIVVIQRGPLAVPVVCIGNFVFSIFGKQSNLKGQRR